MGETTNPITLWCNIENLIFFTSLLKKVKKERQSDYNIALFLWTGKKLSSKSPVSENSTHSKRYKKNCWLDDWTQEMAELIESFTTKTFRKLIRLIDQQIITWSNQIDINYLYLLYINFYIYHIFSIDLNTYYLSKFIHYYL